VDYGVFGLSNRQLLFLNMHYLTENPEIAFLIILLLCFIVGRVPVAGKYFKVVNTLLHETGHTIMTLLTDGNVLKVELFSDTSGVTITQSKGKAGQFFVAFAGYPFASAMAYVLMFLLFNAYFNAIILIIAVIALINVIFFVRNAHGVLWILIFLSLVFINFRYGYKESTMLFAIILSGIVFMESVWSSLVLLRIAFKKPKDAGDAAILHKTSGVDARIWALLFFGFSVFVAYKVIIIYVRFDFDILIKNLNVF